MIKYILITMIAALVHAQELKNWPEDQKELPNYLDQNNPIPLTEEQLLNLELEKVNEENSKTLEGFSPSNGYSSPETDSL